MYTVRFALSFNSPAVIHSIPTSWRGGPITLTIRWLRRSVYRYVFLLCALVGAYATANNGSGTTPAYISHWRYTGIAQQIDNDSFVPSW
ncbi:hypothetical protein C8R44DRAFT_886817 [Mycena epipterygia]|nr:hypothetical protein C8R44DRAFT_886817 [Mycena epipterygia]